MTNFTFVSCEKRESSHRPEEKFFRVYYEPTNKAITLRHISKKIIREKHTVRYCIQYNGQFEWPYCLSDRWSEQKHTKKLWVSHSTSKELLQSKTHETELL